MFIMVCKHPTCHMGTKEGTTLPYLHSVWWREPYDSVLADVSECLQPSGMVYKLVYE